MNRLGLYDGTLQMFIERSRDPDLERLRFLRWLVERGRLEHGVAGPPSGSYWQAAPSDPAERSPVAA